MGVHINKRGYSARARLLALFVMLALVLGGGGSPNPLTELVLEILFVAFALAWFWLPQPSGQNPNSPDRLSFLLLATILFIPLVQLIPLPPSIWAALPGRGNEVDALSLIGKQSSWRPISLSPSRTVAGVLAIVPAAFCLLAVAQIDKDERRLVLATIAFMAVVSAMLGAVQLVARGSSVNLYEQYSQGWVTGFQANHNAEADVLLIGFLALAALAAPYLAGNRRKFLLGLDRRMYSVLVSGLGLLLLLGTVMTGSRTGTVLALVACFAALTIVIVERPRTATRGLPKVMIPIALALIGGFAIYFMSFSQNTAIGRVAERFSDPSHDERVEIWRDTRFAIAQSWPTGVGLGGFEPAIMAAERLEVLDPTVPNRAHNDYLEIGLEAGVLGYIDLSLAVILCFAMAWRAWRDNPNLRYQVVFGSSVLILIALHSVVDYPLRSMAIACLAGVAGGMLAKAKVSVT